MSKKKNFDQDKQHDQSSSQFTNKGTGIETDNDHDKLTGSDSSKNWK